MQALGRCLQIAGLLVVPLGLVHYFSARHVLSEARLMTWELSLLAAGALLFLLGKKLSEES